MQKSTSAYVFVHNFAKKKLFEYQDICLKLVLHFVIIITLTCITNIKMMPNIMHIYAYLWEFKAG